MRSLFVSILAVQVVAYLVLGWFHFFSRQNLQIPVSYIVLHLIAALNLLFLAVGIGSMLAQGAPSGPRMAVIWLSLPPILWVLVLYVIKMVHRWQ